MRPISGETCDLCGEQLPGFQRRAEVQTCAACQETRPSFAKAAAYGAYESELRDLIHLFKYEGVLPAVGVLGGMLAGAICKLNLGKPAMLVVPIPLHTSKRRQRGFNQSELIARAALRKLRMSNLKLTRNVLVRERATASQIGLTRPQRVENVRGAFRVAHPNTVRNCSVLLIDDVLTTGTTASECARVLRRAGAEEVYVATVARTLKQSAAVMRVEPELQEVA